MILSRLLLVAARGSALPVNCRGIGSANGNRNRFDPPEVVLTSRK
jgi:hypothetical protein